MHAEVRGQLRRVGSRAPGIELWLPGQHSKSFTHNAIPSCSHVYLAVQYYYRLINLKSKVLSRRCFDPFQSLIPIPSGTQVWAHSPSLPLLQTLLFIRLFAHFNWSLTSSFWYTAGIQPPSSWVGTVQSQGCRKARLRLWNLTCQLPVQPW